MVENKMVFVAQLGECLACEARCSRIETDLTPKGLSYRWLCFGNVHWSEKPEASVRFRVVPQKRENISIRLRTILKRIITARTQINIGSIPNFPPWRVN